MQLTSKKKSYNIYLKGKAKWANRLYIPDVEYKRWSLQLYPDNEALETIRELQAEGVKNVLKKDDEGYHIQLGRPTEKVIRGKVVAFTPPVVADANGSPTSVAIGNGSDVTVKMEVYTHPTPGGGSAKAMRLESVRIDNLVPFEKDSFNDEEKVQVQGLTEQPAPNF